MKGNLFLLIFDLHLAVCMNIFRRYSVTAQYDKPFDNITQFSDITTPPQFRERLDSRRLNRFARDIILLADAADKVVDKHRHIPSA